DGRTRSIARLSSSGRAQPPGIGASGIHRGAKPVLQCLRFGRNAFRQHGRTATEARVRSSSEESAYQAETERWSGIRTRDTMINSHLLYPSELSLWSKRSESNRCLRVSPMLSMSYILRMAEHETGDRIAPAGISASPDPRPKRRSALIDEAICDCKWRRGNFSQDGRRL